MADAEDVDDIDFDDDFDESIPCSFSYVSICIFFPVSTGMLAGILWSGFSLYVREMGWSLSQAGVVVAVGAISRILVQQAILRIGLWSSALFSALNLTAAILAILFTEQEWAILLEATLVAMLDVTVAVEALAFDQWSDSELMVSQAQSTVLAMFTIACAIAATIGGIVFDTAGWQGITFCHAACASLQLLCIISQPTTWQSLKETVYGIEDEDSDEELESVVPGTGTKKKAEEVEELETVQEETETDLEAARTSRNRGPLLIQVKEQAEDQPSSPPSNGGSLAFAEAQGKEATPELPGAVRDEEKAEDQPSSPLSNRGSLAFAEAQGKEATPELPGAVRDEEQVEHQPSSPPSNRGSVAFAEAQGKEATPELPGAVWDEEQVEHQPSSPPSNRGSVAFGEEKDAPVEFPRTLAIEEPGKKKPRKTRNYRGSMSSANSRSASPSPRGSMFSRAPSPGPRSSAISGNTNGTSGTDSSGHGSTGSRSWRLTSRISHNINCQSTAGGLRGRPSSKSRLSAGTLNTKGSGRSQSTNKTAKTNKTMNTMNTVMSTFSAFTNGENFEHHYALRNALLPQVASRNAQVQLVEPDDDDDDDDDAERETGGSPSRTTGRKSKVKVAMPRDVYIPAALLMMASFCNNLAYSMEWTVYAVYFREQHNWMSATWAGVAQTAGDLLAAFTMSIFKGGERPDLDDYEGIRRYWMAIRAQPYNMSCLLFWWIILTAAIMAPNLIAAVAAQVVMGTVYVFFAKTLTDLNLFFSLGESDIFMKLQVQCRNADSVAVLIASSCGLTLYENFFPESPFLVAFGVACFVFLVFTVGFCHRLGFGVDIETAEERRARRMGIRRVSSWKSVVVKKSQTEMSD